MSTTSKTSRRVKWEWMEVTAHTDWVDLDTGKVTRTSEQVHQCDIGCEPVVELWEGGDCTGEIYTDELDYERALSIVEQWEEKRREQL